MEDEEVVEMETDDLFGASGPIPFQLQLDKPIPFQIKIAEWNPEKDLLAMITDDSKVLLHRFNWQRLWMISPGKHITSLCWRPDGRAIALGIEDGSILLHDVENGKLLRSIKSHNSAVVCLNWEDYAQDATGENDYGLTYQDRTRRFFPPAPRIPRMPGLSSGDSGFMDDGDDGHGELYTLHQDFNMLCSGDQDGFICFNIFGIFPIGKINIQQLSLCPRPPDNHASYHLSNASIQKLALSKNLCKLVVLSYGELSDDMKDKFSEHAELQKSSSSGGSNAGLHSLLLDTSIFLKRKNELHQVAQQASSIGDLIEVIRASLSVLSKQWSDAMNSFHEKFDSLSSLIADHGLDSSSQDEFLSLLYGARTSPPLHQFLVNSLGEAGLKRVSKAVDYAGKELHTVIHEHLQPAIEIIGFRIAELRGLSRWRARYATIGLDERLIDSATEKAGMLLVQVERFSRILAIVLYEFQNFFNWVLKCIKVLLSEPTDQLQPANSELVVVFMKFLLDHDPVGQLLEVNHKVDVDRDTMQQVEELLMFGGFSDTKYLERTLANEFIQMEQCFKEAFLMPFTTVSDKLSCEDFLPLYPLPSSVIFSSLNSPMSVSYYKGGFDAAPQCGKSACNIVDYVCFRIPDQSLDCASCICVVRGFTDGLNTPQKKIHSIEVVILRVPDSYNCVDLSLYKDGQIALLLNEVNSKSESPRSSLLMMIQTNCLNFLPLSSLVPSNLWKLQALKASITEIHLENGKVRTIQDSVTSPLAVSASRGLACVFSSRRHALVYILDEDEDTVSDSE